MRGSPLSQMSRRHSVLVGSSHGSSWRGTKSPRSSPGASWRGVLPLNPRRRRPRQWMAFGVAALGSLVIRELADRRPRPLPFQDVVASEVVYSGGPSFPRSNRRLSEQDIPFARKLIPHPDTTACTQSKAATQRNPLARGPGYCPPPPVSPASRTSPEAPGRGDRITTNIGRRFRPVPRHALLAESILYERGERGRGVGVPACQLSGVVRVQEL